MAIVFPKSVFVHIPRTGGTFTRAALRHTAIHKTSFEAHPPTVKRQAGIHFTVKNIDPAILEGKFVWSNVRNPLSYIRSRWCSHIRSALLLIPNKHAFRADDDFVTFVEKYVEYAPGSISQFFRNYLEKDDKYPAVDYVVKTEELPHGLITALELAGEDVSEEEKQAIIDEPPRHVNASTPEKAAKTELPLSLKKEFLDCEREIIRTFGYDYDELLLL
ncbi:MAG: hypothetical protein ACXADB_03630 [Candidatus Hermodarchaeia archaeon]|jgi:hypothetical protein